MAKILACPTCDQVLHRVAYVSAQSVSAGCDQLARHMWEEHTQDKLTEMLSMTASYSAEFGMSIHDWWKRTRIFCPGCNRRLDHDNGIYTTVNGRVRQCCSLDCMAMMPQ